MYATPFNSTVMMKIKDKKQYIKPSLDTHPIDAEISLVMMTRPPVDPDNPFGIASSNPVVKSKSFFNAESSPFGGDTPNYE